VTESEQLAEILTAHTGRKGPLLPILRDVQAAFGCVSSENETAIAKALNLSRAEVHGVVSFYHDFTARPIRAPGAIVPRRGLPGARG
jgi:formate dehydrogenase subunit gamma